MGSIVIELVSDGRGRLVGRTASDRFNLSVLGLVGMVDDRNGSAIKRARRMLSREYGTAFTLTKVRTGAIALPSPREIESLGHALSHAA